MLGYRNRDLLLQQLGFAHYGLYLKSDLWKGIRRRAFALHGRTCKVCNRPAKCLHHLDYSEETLLGSSLESLVPLCDLCHRKVEFSPGGRKRDVPEAAKAFACLLNPVRPVAEYGKPKKPHQRCVKCGNRKRKGSRLCRPCEK
jgi:hypothetical protein